ncbi:TSL-kinase interacting protein 1 isoform X2 [Populus trichocarpa]|uniref:TSL-kinase interacting protein 1 isoform X2 n=1 Tax=Populus trichocarpa TaxID=3694 RepID=UPI000D1897D8|nr:TSL-kinase interacting protein 1 isoform X2 [Populus trichocarpa]|eukprot:XP_024443873.1 TSL-kinase interacting protein 1 isoform X2 [Populus trichocarpa]
MEAQVSLDSERQLLQNGSIQDGDSGVTSSTPDCVETRQPEKRPTRQWAAWTRQEEESFFTALRQVGKNFEKITHHVQSKNKDQVRHYYYRLVRRMNKLLGPGLCLDAKNSKDTNAAMLRWWSLLEKYSCKASKLHLKPRRFKIFIEALENQLLKDQRKNVRKRSSQGENGSPTTPSIITNQNRASVHDTRTVKLVIVDSQNIQKLGGKGSLKRNVNMGVVRNNNKGDSTAMKPARQRRKPAAYKKWEKAAIAGVSLVADAAEHLERTATDKEDEHDQGKKGLDPVEKLLPHFHPSLRCVESNALTNMKLKLQLFPIDDGTRRALEMDKHNPHLELTLSTRKKISSVLEHLNRKWGDSTVASGELMLFPYSVNRENLVSYQRWTQDSLVSAADVYFSIGSPPVFRLRYGWFFNVNFASVTLQAPSTYSCLPVGGNEKDKTMDSVPTAEPSTSDQFEKPENPCRDCPTSENNNHASILHSAGVTNENNEFVATGPRNNLVKSFDPAANISLHRKETDDRTNTQQSEDVDGLRLSNVNPLSAGEWADSLTNVSIGDLLSELPHVANHNCIESLIVQSNQCLQEIPFSCDSFDAAIAAHISRHQGKMGFHSAVASYTSSIWDGEETCDAFAFQKNHSLRKEVTTSSAVASPRVSKQMDRTSSITSSAFLEELPVIEGPNDYPTGGEPMDECSSDSQVVSNQVKDFNGLTDIYWPDSLGLLDLDIPSSKYHTEDLILSDSLGGLNHLIASSLDAFQNCSFFGLNKKDSISTVEARETTSFSDFKISGGV